MFIRTVALSIATAAALTGCMSSGGDTGDGPAKPPAGGWPQPEDGKLTAKMCGLLTAADFKPVGHNLIRALEAQPGKDSSNYVSCAGILGEWLTLDLQPTAESAKIRYDRSLDTRKDVVIVEKQQTVLAQDLLQGADQSWFDYGQAPAGTKPGNPVYLKVDASSPATANPLALSCSISVRGKVVKQVQQVGFAICDSRSAVH